jgi:hypothetical protein
MASSKKPTYNEIQFDSPEEREFYWWCEEAIDIGVIWSYEYHPEPIELSLPVKVGKRSLLRSHSYTPDYLLYAEGTIDPFYPKTGLIYVDVKGGFSLYNNHREFSINQKWIYQKHGTYINKVVPEKFFKKMWVPEKARLTEKTQKVRKKYEECRTVEEFRNG